MIFQRFNVPVLCRIRRIAITVTIRGVVVPWQHIVNVYVGS